METRAREVDKIDRDHWLNLRPSDLEIRRELVSDPHESEAIRRTLVEVLSKLDGSHEQDAYDAFMLGAHMRHVYRLNSAFDHIADDGMTLADIYFREGLSGKPFDIVEERPSIKVSGVSYLLPPRRQNLSRKTLVDLNRSARQRLVEPLHAAVGE